MKKTLLLLFLSFFCCVIQVIAQERAVSGKVTDAANGDGLPGVTILIKGSNTASATDQNGNFKINVPANNAVLVFSYIGYTRKEIPVTGITLNVSLTADNKQLSEVVITAYGIKQERKALGYSVQELSGEDLTRSKQPNIVNALQGKVAGVFIQSSGGAPGAGSSIIIRGITSLSPTANNQPLFVVDGIPISNETTTSNVLPSAGSNSSGSNEQFSFTNRAADINPDDIESLSVLKGPAATALYGLRAANGVIIITTKRGKNGAPSINFSSTAGLSNVVTYPEIQTTYGEGLGGRSRVANGQSAFYAFGPPLRPGEKVYQNFKDFFVTGADYTNSLNVSGGNDKTTYYSSVSNLYQQGVVPSTNYQRTTFKLSSTSKLSDKFSINGSANYSLSGGKRPSGGDKGTMSALSYYATTYDVNDYIYPDGSQKSFSPGNVDNPVYVAKYSQLKDNVNRLIGNAGFTYTPAKWLNIDYKIGGDFYSDARTRIVPGPRYAGDPNTLDIAISNGGFVVNDRINYKEINSNFLATLTKTINEDWNTSLLIGNNVLYQNTDQVNVRGEKFAIPYFYDISNTSNLYSYRAITQRKLVGIFGDAKISYKNAIFLDVTGRNDWSSTLPSANNSFFYPSVSLSYAFTDLHKISSDFFSFGKLRASYAQVGKDAVPYVNGPYYSSYSGFPFNSIPGFSKSTTFADPTLKPERTSSVEFGTELRFFKNKIGLDVTVYQADSKDQIIPVPVTYTSGYSIYYTNAGEIRNRGLEILLSGKAISHKDFGWDVALNWSKRDGKVLSIKDGISEIVFDSNQRIYNKLVVGGSAGDLYGRPYKRDASGNLIINALGYPEISTNYVKVGNAFPDWQGGLTNTFRYKNFTLSALLEVKWGGDVHDVSMRNSIRQGILKTTENRYEALIFNGVKADGTVNNKVVQLDDAFYRNENYFNGASDVILQDASWIRLRNVTFSYRLPAKLLSRTKFIKGLSFSAIGNNFLLWTPFKGYDPEGSSYGSGSNAFGFMGFNIPSTRSLSLSLNANF